MENNINNNEEKYYVRSNGEKIKLKELHFEHLANGYSKKLRDMYNCTTKKEFDEKLKETNDIKEEIFRRYNEFYETLKDEEE